MLLHRFFNEPENLRLPKYLRSIDNSHSTPQLNSCIRVPSSQDATNNAQLNKDDVAHKELFISYAVSICHDAYDTGLDLHPKYTEGIRC